MKAKIAAAVLFVAAATAPAAVDAYMTFVTLPQAVKLGDGSVLPAGRYDVKIDYKGFGNTAELSFFTGGVFKGKTNAEARGFPAQAPAALPAGVASQKVVKMDNTVKLDNGVKLDPAAEKGVKIEGIKGESADDKHKDEIHIESFSWGKSGFPPGAGGKATPSGRSLKLSFDSANSSAGFSALVPAVQK